MIPIVTDKNSNCSAADQQQAVQLQNALCGDLTVTSGTVTATLASATGSTSINTASTALNSAASSASSAVAGTLSLKS